MDALIKPLRPNRPSDAKSGDIKLPEARPAELDPAEFLEGRVVLLAQLLGLLVAFIGANLTVRLVREVWPRVTLNDLDFNKGGKNEKAK